MYLTFLSLDTISLQYTASHCFIAFTTSGHHEINLYEILT